MQLAPGTDVEGLPADAGPGHSPEEAAPRPPKGGWPRPLSFVVVAGGLVITLVLAWAASTVNNRSTVSLLHLEVRQTATALAAAVPSVQTELEDALSVARATNSPSIFKRFVAPRVSVNGGNLASISLWRRTPAGTKLLAFEGAYPLLAAGRAHLLSRVHPASELQVTGIIEGASPRLGYAEMAPGDTRYIVYAESSLPKDRKFVVPASSPFAELNFALYLGPVPRTSQLIEQSAPIGAGSLQASASVPFGDTVITLVGSPRTQLAGGLSLALPWIILGVGIAFSLASGAVVDYLARGRRAAEHATGEMTDLYTEQQSIASTLQQALLPASTPGIRDMDIAVRYHPGASGADVGGDWYDVVMLDEGRFVFVIGDVSGRGAGAAAVMASLQYAARGFALEGHPPETILEHLAKMLNIVRDGHFATVLCGEVDVRAHEVRMANAGHLPPVLCRGGVATLVEVKPAPPIGLSKRWTAEAAVLKVLPQSTLIVYTDGLVERRDEPIEDGLARLQVAAEGHAGSLESLMTSLVSDLTKESQEDDIALIGMRWQD